MKVKNQFTSKSIKIPIMPFPSMEKEPRSTALCGYFFNVSPF